MSRSSVSDMEEMSQQTRQVARHQIRDSLQAMILTGERKPGSKLVQQQLAQQFGVAQGVVREALLELQAYGLVETIDNRGIFVSELNAQKLIESFEVREMHEALAVRLCCERMTRAENKELVEMAEKIFELGVEGCLDRMGSLDREFHHRIIQIASNSMLIRLAENYRVLGKFVRANRDPRPVRDEHLAILKAIEEGRADDAEQLIRRHIRAAREAVEQRIKDRSFVPHWVL